METLTIKQKWAICQWLLHKEAADRLKERRGFSEFKAFLAEINAEKERLSIFMQAEATGLHKMGITIDCLSEGHRQTYFQILAWALASKWGIDLETYL